MISITATETLGEVSRSITVSFDRPIPKGLDRTLEIDRLQTLMWGSHSDKEAWGQGKRSEDESSIKINAGA